MKTQHEAGFSLLEMLIALAIFGTAAAALSYMFALSRYTLDRISYDLDVIESLQTLRFAIGDTLSETVMSDPARQLQGDSSRLTVYASAPRALGLANPSLTTFDIQSSEKRLEGVWQAQESDKGTARHALTELKGQFSFLYSGRDMHWTTDARTARFVKLQASFPGEVSIWEMVFPVRGINMFGCRYLKEQPCLPLR